MKAKIYSKDNCPYCLRAKALLSNKEFEYEEIKIGVDIEREAFLELFPNAKTVPQIFLNVSGSEFYVGGYTELAAYFDGQTSK